MSTTAYSGDEHHTRRRAAKGLEDDPFFHDASLTSNIEPAKLASENTTGSNLLLDLFWTPLSMIGFLLSLQWVDRRQQQSRSVTNSSTWSRLMRWAFSVEPHQLPEDSTWTTTTDAGAAVLANAHDIRPKHKSRRVAKMQISDAFELRGRVLLVLSAWMGFVIVLLVFISFRFYIWVA
ncbi:hypothetical protein AMS68_005510 [Peltaster fructicola]|uniref:Uncharacterized protein n=1 Tax=Peltaster fructicola TaxID=286661 RepID=A0A6H0XZ08_9PEZI|nr:hypothetical protein AMS68_005510 [Peltaster fructicola]